MRVVREAWVVRPVFTYVLAAPLTLAILAFVVVGVNLWMGDLPPELEATTPWFALAGVAFLVLTALLAWRGRIKVRLVEGDAGRYLEIYDPKGVIVVPPPLTCRYGHYPDPLSKGRQTVLLAGIFHEGQCKVAFKEVWGSAYEPPMTWPEEIPLLGAPVQYDALLGTFLVPMIAAIEEG